MVSDFSRSRVCFVFCVIGTFMLVGCQHQQQPLNSNLTQGNIQRVIEPGYTTKSEILDVFGAPNITTRDGSGAEVWTYQRSEQGAKLRTGWSSAGFRSNSRMMTLIIRFNKNDVVIDFNNRASNF